MVHPAIYPRGRGVPPHLKKDGGEGGTPSPHPAAGSPSGWVLSPRRRAPGSLPDPDAGGPPGGIRQGGVSPGSSPVVKGGPPSKKNRRGGGGTPYPPPPCQPE